MRAGRNAQPSHKPNPKEILMARMNKIIGTGCFFLCLGGWVYSGQARAEDTVTDGKTLALQNAVKDAAAIVPQPTLAPAPEKAPVVAPTPVAAPAATAVAPQVNLNAGDVSVDAAGNIEALNLPNMEIDQALRLLSIQGKRNIISSKEVKGTVTAYLSHVTFEEALDGILKPNGFGWVAKGNFIYVYSQKELDDQAKNNRKPANKIFHLKYVNAADAAAIIKPALSSTGQIALTPPSLANISTSDTQTDGNGYATDDTLVINDFPENLSEVDRLLKDLDVRPKQVLIEATILRANLTEDNALGIDLISLSGINLATLAGATATNNTSGSTTGGTTGTTGSTSSTLGPLGALGGQTIPSSGGTQTNVGTNFASSVPTGGLSVGFLSNSVSIFVRALETTVDTTVVANPKILALNKHRGEVFIGQEFGYLTTTTTSTTTQQTVTFLDTGTKLVFRPFITDDGYVRLEVHPEDSSGGLSAANLPQKASTEVTSNLMIKDGRTVVIGGLFREQTSASRGQVPVLGSIPVLGVPFRQTADDTQRTETIVLLTPHIINDDTALYEESQKQQEDVTRMMLGNRAGLQPWGRDRIAQIWYGKAQEQLEKGNKEKALMYTDWALNSNPRFIEAIKLREQLTLKKMQEADESAIHSFVQNTLRDDKDTIPNTGGAAHRPPAAPEAPATPAKP